MVVCPRSRWLAFALAWGLCPLFAGCIPVGYVYPTVLNTPAVAVGARPDEVFAFRVDAVDEWNEVEYPCSEALGVPAAATNERWAVNRYTLKRVPLTGGDRVTPQSLVAVDYGWVWHRVVVSDSGHSRHNMTVRLYRPGWKTVEVRDGASDEPIRWQEAPDLESQERAVDDLLLAWKKDGHDHAAEAIPGVSGMEVSKQPTERAMVSTLHLLARGSSAKGHRKALLFAASEYERLAKFAADESSREVRARLEGKAKSLHDLANR